MAEGRDWGLGDVNMVMNLFFIIAPCILIFTQFIHQQMHIN